jgi:hypothetical protein
MQTSTQNHTLDPVFNEDFVIDVTNPNALLNIVVKRRRELGLNHEFLGQVQFRCGDFADGAERIMKVGVV